MHRWLAFAIACAGVGFACAPSYQAVYEGNVRFEHCYRLDMDPRVTPSHRQRCWGEWLRLYTYGQNRDRVEYARRRVDTLASGDATPPHRPGDHDAGPARSATALPAPTSPHEPPPPTSLSRDAAASTAEASSPTAPPPPPKSECITGCRDVWHACVGRCTEADAGDPPTRKSGSKKDPCQRCGKDYRRCMQRCFK